MPDVKYGTILKKLYSININLNKKDDNDLSLSSANLSKKARLSHLKFSHKYCGLKISLFYVEVDNLGAISAKSFE